MKYYSEKLNKLFDTQSELIECENAYVEAKSNETLRKEKLEEALNKYNERKKEVNKILDEAEEKAKELYKQICELYDQANDKASKLQEEASKEYNEAKRKYGKEYTFDDLLAILGW